MINFKYGLEAQKVKVIVVNNKYFGTLTFMLSSVLLLSELHVVRGYGGAFKLIEGIILNNLVGGASLILIFSSSSSVTV